MTLTSTPRHVVVSEWLIGLLFPGGVGDVVWS
jgi:hypothetical protein